ncbi:MAG: hypothetical protein WD604_14500 [Balneolaceae bacterium]
MKDGKKKHKYADYYNKYVEYYNSGGLSAFSELATIRNQVNERITELHELIEQQVNELDDQLFYDRTGEPNIGHDRISPNSDPQTIEQSQVLVENLKTTIATRLHIINPSEMLKTGTESIKEFYSRNLPNVNPDMAILLVGNIAHFGEKINSIERNRRAISAITGKIIDSGFLKMQPWENLSTEEKAEIELSEKDSIIKEFVNAFEGEYSASAMCIYLKAWMDKAGYSKRRARAKKDERVQMCKELENIHDGTLRGWENSFKKVYETRTGKQA